MQRGLFSLLSPRFHFATLAEQLEDLNKQFEDLVKTGTPDLRNLLQARFYLSDAANQYDELMRSDLVKELVGLGAFSYIEQPPLSGVKVSLLLWFVGGKVLEREALTLPLGSFLALKTDKLTYYLQTVRFAGDNAAKDAYQQTEEAFEAHVRQLQLRGLNLRDHCQRTWFYVRDVDRHYAAMVKARNDLFDREGLTSETHYITSTGIGGASEDRQALIAVDFFSVDGLRSTEVGYLSALDYLNPTREYGVAFERGTYLDLPGERLYMLSGTASIDRYGECLHRGDVLTQAGRLFLNIEKLLESAGGDMSDLCYLIVYLRDIADYASVNQYLTLRFPHIPFLITEARVCRPEWLIEVEAMATESAEK